MYKKLFVILALFSFLPHFLVCQNKFRENGWYHILSGQTDSISQEPIVTIKDFISLRLETDYFGKNVISGQISKYKSNKWAKETEKAIGRQIAFVFNDSIITDSRVNCRIESGAFQITSILDKELPGIYEQLKQEKIDSIEALFKGWEKDSLFYTMPPKQRDSIRIATDYWEASAWVDLMTKPDEHYWYSITNSSEYKKLEEALQAELGKPNFSSRASDYMKSKAYQAYKTYICNDPEYINLMFKSFLFNQFKGLNGYLIDDIIQTRYPFAPSIRAYVEKTDNSDDERFAVYKWQRKIWFLMNKEKKNQQYEEKTAGVD